MNKLTKTTGSLLLTAAITASVCAVSFSAQAAESGSIRLIVKNETYSTAQGAKWDGVLLDKTVSISETGDALSTVKQALADAGKELVMVDSQWGSYISAIEGVAENDAAMYSGWMGVQNDWAVNNNLAYIDLRDGDTFEMTYSVNMGVDIGADWSNTSTALKSLTIDGLTLNESFDPSNTDYTVTIGSDSKTVFAQPVASNKYYQVRTYKNTYIPMEYGFRTTDAIDVKAGDTLYIGVGNAAWPGSYPAETVYSVYVMEKDAALSDVNFDGKLDIVDATLIQYASIDLVPFSSLQKSLADFNADGRISILDTTAIQHKLAE